MLLLIQAGDFVKALDLVEATLRQQPTDPKATEWLVRLIEGPTVPLRQRLRAARLAAQVGDSRPGVCTFEPAWCNISGDRYLIASQFAPFNEVSFIPQWVRLKSFRIARYPVTVWQFRLFWEDPSGYSDRQWWSSEGWAWKQENGITHPYHWGDADWMLPNQPVAGVTRRSRSAPG
jgi:formylglycine-generating enzyme required for sulfatase activity